jgi:hypothetical protein
VCCLLLAACTCCGLRWLLLLLLLLLLLRLLLLRTSDRRLRCVSCRDVKVRTQLQLPCGCAVSRVTWCCAGLSNGWMRGAAPTTQHRSCCASHGQHSTKRQQQ